MCALISGADLEASLLRKRKTFVTAPPPSRSLTPPPGVSSAHSNLKFLLWYQLVSEVGRGEGARIEHLLEGALERELSSCQYLEQA